MGGWSPGGGITAAEREKLSKIDVGLKSNLNATSAPTKDDDEKDGYGVGSTWKYNGATYVCGNAKEGAAEWADSNEIYYFNTWAQLISAISVVGTSYVNKYASVANANGGPVGGSTYTAPATLTNYIVDGGSATYKILAQGDNYSVSCMPRNITNPVITKVMVVPENKPTIPGYYIFTVNPNDGLPPGVGLNDITYFDGSVWEVYQIYIKATTVLVATNQTMTTQVTWRKFAGTWMSTADEYIPDGKEYQTGKLYNGKAVYRKCISGTSGAAISNNYTCKSATNQTITIPVNGVLLTIGGCIDRNDNKRFNIPGYEAQFFIDKTTRNLWHWLTWDVFCNQPYIVWVEYTKS